MGWLGFLGGASSGGGRAKADAAPASRNSGASRNSTQSGTAHQIRKDVLKVALRETLLRHGIPSAWLSADVLRTPTPKREEGLHVRFLVRHWDARLPQFGPALQQEFTQRLLMLDPKAGDWLMGFSWQFALPDPSLCPSLPPAGSWTAAPVAAREAAPAQPEQPSADVIQGPVRIAPAADDPRADLERLLAVRDADHQRHSADSYAPTRPSTLSE